MHHVLGRPLHADHLPNDLLFAHSGPRIDVRAMAIGGPMWTPLEAVYQQAAVDREGRRGSVQNTGRYGTAFSAVGQH